MDLNYFVPFIFQTGLAIKLGISQKKTRFQLKKVDKPLGHIRARPLLALPMFAY